MSSEKSKIPLALGIAWVGIGLATAILAYGTHAGARHPNPSILLISLPAILGGMTPAFRSANKIALIVLQVVCLLIFVAVVVAMDSKMIGPNWPAYTTVVTALVLGLISFVAASALEATPSAETDDDARVDQT